MGRFLVFLLSLTLLLAGGNGLSFRCPNGFVGFGESCYKFVKMATSWMEAKVLCETMNSHLVEVESPYEEQFIIERVFIVDPDLQEAQALWLGASDLMNENEWVWMHSKKVMGYHNWNYDPEIAMAKGHGRCLAMQTHPTISWVEAKCDERFNFVCEHEML